MLATLFTGFFLLASLMLGSAAQAHADPYCGPGMNFDGAHDICQPGNPVPMPGLAPYPLPYQQHGPSAGDPYPPYGGN